MGFVVEAASGSGGGAAVGTSAGAVVGAFVGAGVLTVGVVWSPDAKHPDTVKLATAIMIAKIVIRFLNFIVKSFISLFLLSSFHFHNYLYVCIIFVILPCIYTQTRNSTKKDMNLYFLILNC